MTEIVSSAIGRVTEIGLSWRSEVGRATGIFAITVLEETRQDDDDAFVVEVLGFKQCRYTTSSGNPGPPGAVTSLAELPTVLQEEIDLLLGRSFTVACAVVDEGLIAYVQNPRA